LTRLTTRHIFGDNASLAASLRGIAQLTSARGTGVVSEVALQGIAFDGSSGRTRTLSGMWYLALDVDVDGGSLAMHGVLSQDGPTGVQIFAGEILDAHCALLTVRAELEGASASPAVRGVTGDATAVFASPTPAPEDSTPKPRAEASAPVLLGVALSSSGATAMPQKPRRVEIDLSDALTPETGDFVEHFAFGRCEVVKSDGERLHVRLPKDSRTKEIAIAMLRVTRLADSSEKRVFRLDRKM
jgi:hypothetical protein